MWIGAAVLFAQAGSTSRASSPSAQAAAARQAAPAAPAAAQTSKPVAPVAAAVPGPSPADAAKHQAWIKQHCVGCHNSRAPQPANDPVNLETARLDNLLPQAATWERVLRKLSVRAMPPQTMPRPAEAEYAAFTTWLSGSLDRAWQGKSNPGRYVVHRLNRTEYGNAIRDLLALDIDVAELLPSDGADFGFDNIASSLRTSPLLLERYLTAAQRISTLAVGDPTVRLGTTEYPISREFSQSGHIEGLPLGTRGGTQVRHVFPADAEYKLFGRLVRGVEEGYAGVEGNETPDTFVITIDGEEVYSAQIGGPKDHEVQAKDMNEAKAIVDARMTGRAFVTAGPHDVGFTWRERPGQRQDVWQPALRDSQEVHMIGGLARLKTVGVEGPYNVKGVSASASREKVFICKPASAADESACAQKIFTNLARRAYRRPVTADDVEPPMQFYSAGPRGERQLRRRNPRRRRAHSRQHVVPVPHGTRRRWRAGRCRTSGQRHRARLAAVLLPVEQHSRSAVDGSGRRRPSASTRRAGRAGSSHDCRRTGQCAGQQLRRAVAAAAQPRGEGRARTC